MARQLRLDLAFRPAHGREDFLVAPSNAEAVALVDQWPKWPSYAAIICGPPGSGKSHLAECWQQKAGALASTCANFTLENLPQLLQNNALVLEDMDVGTLPETTLFHCLNLARQQGGSILLTAKQLPKLALPDLASRLNAMPIAQIKEPDDALLRGVLVKHFSDRQIHVDEPLLSYMLTRMPRSLSAARHLVAAIDDQALEQGAEISRVFVSRVLNQMQSPELFYRNSTQILSQICHVGVVC